MASEESGNGWDLIWQHKKDENPFDKYEQVGTFATSNQFQFDVVNYNDESYAMKYMKIALSTADSAESIKNIRNEIGKTGAMDHPNIVKVFDVYEYSGSIYVVRELCKGHVVFSADKTAPISEERAAQIVRQILAAIRYMHDQGCIHGNLRPEHIIYEDESPESSVKLTDFGIAQYENELAGKETERNVQSIDDNPCAAPELTTGKYSDRSDVWSIGVLTYRLLSGKFPFTNAEEEVFKTVHSIRVDFDDPVWNDRSEACKDFLRSLLQVDVDQRLTAKSAQKHAWMRKQEKIKKSLVKDVIHHWRTQHSKSPRLKRAALRVIAYTATSPIIHEIRQVFEFFDKTKNGVITFKEFDMKIGEVLNMSTRKAKTLFDKMDITGSGTITYCEFLGATLEFRGELDEREVEEAFIKIDKAHNSNGYITIRDLVSNWQIPQATAESMIQEIDLDGNGIINFEEFLSMFRVKYDDDEPPGKYDKKRKKKKPSVERKKSSDKPAKATKSKKQSKKKAVKQ